MLALDKAVPDLYAEGKHLQRNGALAEHEKKRMQVDHAHIGGWLMESCNLTERLHRAIKHSHQLDLSFSADPVQVLERGSTDPPRFKHIRT